MNVKYFAENLRDAIREMEARKREEELELTYKQIEYFHKEVMHNLGLLIEIIQDIQDECDDKKS